MTVTTLRPKTPAPRVRPPRQPFRREDLFREPAYTDGKPYASDDEDDDTDD